MARRRPPASSKASVPPPPEPSGSSSFRPAFPCRPRSTRPEGRRGLGAPSSSASERPLGGWRGAHRRDLGRDGPGRGSDSGPCRALGASTRLRRDRRGDVPQGGRRRPGRADSRRVRGRAARGTAGGSAPGGAGSPARGSGGRAAGAESWRRCREQPRGRAASSLGPRCRLRVLATLPPLSPPRPASWWRTSPCGRSAPARRRPPTTLPAPTRLSATFLEARRPEGAERVPVLYGGSVGPGNAAALVAAAGVDGVLVGGASLDPKSFAEIVEAAAGAS